MLIGLPGSGKSTLAKEISKKESAIVISSDDIREELFGDINSQENNDLIFKEMNSRSNTYLQKGQNVIYDATNINRRRRKHIINFEIKADEKIAYYLNNSIKNVKEQNEKRDRKVDHKVIERMYKNLHIPILNEGWSQVIYKVSETKSLEQYKNNCEDIILNSVDHDTLFENLFGYIHEFKDIYNLPHDSSYHSFSVSRHTYHVYKFIKDNYHKNDKILMLWASLFHDLGKGFCKSFVNFKGEETKYANFIGHEQVSSQLAAWYLTLLNYEDHFVKNIVSLVQFHMVPMNSSEKKLSELQKILGVDLFEKLIFLHQADLQAK